MDTLLFYEFNLLYVAAVCSHLCANVFLVSEHDFSLGLLSTSGYAVYAQYVSVEYFNPDFAGLK